MNLVLGCREERKDTNEVRRKISWPKECLDNMRSYLDIINNLHGCSWLIHNDTHEY